MTFNNKIKVHIKNNRGRPGKFPCDLEGEKNFTITKKHIENALKNEPELKKKIDFFIDWDEDNFNSSISNSDILLTYDFPISNLKKNAPKLKWIHCTAAGVEHLYPFNWVYKGLKITNSSGVHSEKAGEYGLMSVLMLQNHIPKIFTNQNYRKYVSLFSNPIKGKNIVLVGTGSLGSSMAKIVHPLGANIIGVNKRGKPVAGCSKVVKIDKIDRVLPLADILYLALPETPQTKNLINKKRLNLLKKTCGIVNIGRQSVLDYEILFKKLIKNELAGAILDVFNQEPIEKKSKFWKIPNLIITPHVSSDDHGNYIEKTLSLFIKNLKLFLKKKKMITEIDINLGY